MSNLLSLLPDGDFFTFTRHEPIGVCGQIIPVSWSLLCKTQGFLLWMEMLLRFCRSKCICEILPLRSFHLLKDRGYPEYPSSSTTWSVWWVSQAQSECIQQAQWYSAIYSQAALWSVKIFSSEVTYFKWRLTRPTRVWTSKSLRNSPFKPICEGLHGFNGGYEYGCMHKTFLIHPPLCTWQVWTVPAQQLTRFWNSQLIYQVYSAMWVLMFFISACRFAISSEHHTDLENITGIHLHPHSRRAWESAGLNSRKTRCGCFEIKLLPGSMNS